MDFFFLFTAKEHVVGWYSTGPKLRENDLDIHGLFNEYVLIRKLVYNNISMPCVFFTSF